MITAFTWAITVLSFTGTALNVRKNIWCFYLWAVGNIAWLGFDLWSGLYSRAVFGRRASGLRRLGSHCVETKKPLGVRG